MTSFHLNQEEIAHINILRTLTTSQREVVLIAAVEIAKQSTPSPQPLPYGKVVVPLAR